MRRSVDFKTFCLATSALLSVVSCPAWGQSSGEDQEKQDDVRKSDIVVTGTSIKGVKSIASPSTVIDREAIIRSGATNAAEVLRNIPQTQGSSTFSNDQPSQANPYVGSTITGGGTLFNNETRGSSVDIRGLGPNATLVLVDGRRQVAGGTGTSFSEANILPLAAIERIEVVTDGASAIYGSNAIGGVINYITRKDYSGAEFSGRYSTNRLYDEWGGSLVVGQSWKLGDRSGRIMVSYDYGQRQNVAFDASRYIRSDLTPLGGGNAIYSSFQQPAPTGLGYYVAQSCPPPAFIIFGTCFNPDFSPGTVNQYFDVTAANGNGVPTASIPAGRLPVNSLADTDALRDYIGKQKTHSANIYLRQEILPDLELYYQGSLYWRNEDIRNFDVLDTVVERGTAFFPTDAPVIANSVTVPIGVATTAHLRTRNWAHTFGAKLDLSDNWTSEGYVSFSKSSNKVAGVDSRYPDQDILNFLIRGGRFNPFLGLDDATRAAATYQGDVQGGSYSNSKSLIANLRLNGTIADIAGGSIKGAFGVEYQDLSNNYYYAEQGQQTCVGVVLTDNCLPSTPVLNPDRSGHASRNVKAAFAEILLPFVGADNARPLVQRFELSIAGRYEDYSDFGQTFNPRFGVVWEMNDAVRLRSTWGTAFRAPNLIEMSANFIGYVGPGANNAGPEFGQTGPIQAVIVGGGNPNLGPEKSKNFTIGADLTPLSGLKISGTYYHIAYKDKIQALPVGAFISSPENGALYREFIQVVANPNPPGCNPQNPASWAPEIQAILPREPRLDGVCGATVILDGRWANASKVVQQGLDASIDYTWAMGENNLSAGVSVTKIFSIHEEVVKGRTTTPEPLNRIFQPLDFRANARLGWSNGPWTANLSVNYTPSYVNDLPITPTGPAGPLPALPVTRIRSWTTADLGIGYTVPESLGSIAGGLRLNLNIRNLTDKDPPVVLYGNAGFDARVHSIYGRTWTIQATKAF
ncbi:iron complex outermembrane receptor protein [Sphingobium sp. OAS761]|uniref:TonB-dependent receptor domain-containing protein n=1 Tax=Sphingobium sp. OAS761 TaxID=2817901 RepID=UPI002646CC10|nr:TonB-dependent receptor [Sphingobium sp. OAS761]MCP1470475.1 iron complex outermembrane receptor protein [Sphingobium sp. OAS761]